MKKINYNLDMPIAVVDDNEVKRYAISKTLNKAGFNTVECATGTEILQSAKDLNPLLIILDVKLPDIHGFEVCRRLKADPLTNQIPILHISASYTSSEDRVTGLEGGADAYLTYDSETAELIATVRALLRMRHAEENLRLLIQQWQNTFESIADGILLLNNKGEVLRYNNAAKDILDVKTDVTGLWYKLLPENTFTKDNCPVLRMEKEKKPQVVIFKAFEKWIRLSVHPIINELNKITGSVCILTDITKTKEIEIALEESEARFRQMANSIPQLAWIADENGDVFWYNQRWYDYTGLSQDDMHNKGWQKIIEPEILPSVMDQLEYSFKTGERFNMVIPLKNKNGEYRSFLTFMVPITGQGNKIVRWFGTNTDISDQIKIEEQLIEARNKAESANIAKSEFLANMSHEIRTPMNAVIGLAHILSHSSPLTPKQKECIDTIQISADSLLALINDLLDVAKIEARTVELEQISFDLEKLVEEIKNLISVKADEKNLEFISRVKCSSGRFIGDPNRIKQILVNICTNAVKFTEKGSVTLEAECHEVNSDEYDLTFRIIDTGIGIPKDKVAVVFDKFVQADSSVNRRYGGTGLGLAITKSLLELMNGTIEVKSEIGEGSCFIINIRLPIDKNSIEPKAVSDFNIHPAEMKNGNPVVLLVEDYAANILVAGAFLEQFNYEYDVAQNGIEAIEKVKSRTYAAILMDVQMHEMNGYEATRHIREHEKKFKMARIPIIGMTAYALIGDREKCIEAGMDDYISKPFNPQELREKLSSHINPKTPSVKRVIN